MSEEGGNGASSVSDHRGGGVDPGGPYLPYPRSEETVVVCGG